MPTLSAGSTVSLSLDNDDVLTTSGNGRFQVTPTTGSKSEGSLTGTQNIGPFQQYVTVSLTALTDIFYSTATNSGVAPAAKFALDSSGNVTGLMGPDGNGSGLVGWVPPTNDYAGCMAAINAAVASPSCKTVLFQDATYNLGSNYLPIISGLSYIGVKTRFNWQNGGYIGKNRNIVGGTVFTSTASAVFWDGMSDQVAVTATVAAQNCNITAGSANIPVANSAVFTVGQRVYVTATVGNFYAGLCYIVLTASANVITVGLAGSSAIVASTSGVLNISSGMPNDCTANVLMQDLAFYGCNTAIKCGAKNTFSFVYSKISNIYTTSRSVTARQIDIRNYNQCTFERIYTNDGDGQWWGCDYPQGTYLPGNAFFSQLFNSNANQTTLGVNSSQYVQRGIVFQAETGSYLNELHIDSLQNSNKVSATRSDSAVSTTSGVANITPTNASLWPVDLPVYWTANTPSGFTLNVTYFVISNNGTVIQLSDKKGGNAITPTSSGSAGGLSSMGYPHVEIVGIGTGQTANSMAKDFDLEGNATCMMLVQNSLLDVTNIGQTALADGHVMLCGRSFSGSISSKNPANSDLDVGSASLMKFGAWTNAGSVNSFGGVGIWTDANIGAGTYALNLHPQNTPAFPDMYAVFPTGGATWTRASSPICDKVLSQDTSKTFGSGTNDAAVTVFNGAAGQTFTLPIIVDTTATNTLVGCRWTFTNASGTNTLAVASQSSQAIIGGGASVTTYTLAINTTATFTACKTAGGTLFWSVK